jgi:adenine-specific DNA-methyltransferase
VEQLNIPPEYAGRQLSELTADQLLEVLEANSEGGIRIAFAGKSNARRLARRVRPRVTNTVKSLGHGSNEDRSLNLLIEGDNLQAMSTLYRERGNVDLVLADPPYNTGFDWRYNDRWEEDPNDPGMGEFVSEDDSARHTKWMRFMWPRLQMIKSMLKPTGVLAICIDHRELFRLGQMLDELFGEKNRLAIINWQKQTSPKNQDTSVSTMTEYVLVYAKDRERAATGLVERSPETRSSYTNPDEDPRGEWTPSDPTLMGASTHPGQVYGIQNPFTGNLHYPQEGRCWRNERAKMKAGVEEWGVEYEDTQLDDGLHPALLVKGATDPRALADPLDAPAIADARQRAMERREKGDWPQYFWRNDRRRVPGAGELRYKTYIEEIKKGVVPTTFWADEEFDLLDLGSVSWEHEQAGTSDIGKAELNAIVGRGHGFDTVKPLALFTKIISIWCPTDGLVLDPFAGSGTTGHGALLLNADGGSTRRFICIEQGRPEKGDSYARTLTADRLQRVLSGKWVNKKKDTVALSGGFEYKRLGKRVDATVLLKMERDEMVDTVIASHFDATRRRGERLVRIEDAGAPYRYLVARDSEQEGFFLVWDGPDENTDLTESVYEACAEEAALAGIRSAPLHVYARLYRFQTEAVRFYQIPDRILADFGLDLSSEPFATTDED